MPNDIWAGVNFGDSIVNPGSVAQTYNTKTGQTTYGQNTATKTVAASSAANAAKGINAPAVATPEGTPAGAPVYQGGALGYAPSSPNTNFSEVPGSNGVGIQSPYAANPNAFPTVKASTPNAENNPAPKADTARNQFGQTMAEANDPANWLDGVYAPPLTKEDGSKITNADPAYRDYAKNAGLNISHIDPLYIGATNWAKLQKQYTPYQLQQATIRTKDGIFWNPNVNIGTIPPSDPQDQINADTKTIANLITDAKAGADKTTVKSDKPVIADDAATNEDTLMDMLSGQFGNQSAEAIYKELYNSPEMKAAQADVIKYKAKNDEYDQQIEDLKEDIRVEVEGEAPESYITALATVRGDKILKAKRANQIDLDAANSTLTNLKENATNLLNVRIKDNDTRYNNLFNMLQLQIQQEGTAFNQEIALANIAMSLPENRSITINGVTYKGLKENDNLNVIQFTDRNGKTYVIGVDKKTGKEQYRQYIGTSSTGSGGSTSAVTQLNEWNATRELANNKLYADLIDKGELDIAYDEKGNSFYYDKPAYDAAYKEATTGFAWGAFEKNPDKIDFRK